MHRSVLIISSYMIEPWAKEEKKKRERNIGMGDQIHPCICPLLEKNSPYSGILLLLRMY